MRDICVIGDYDSICGYSVLGMKICAVKTFQEAGEMLDKVAETAKIVFITEPFAQNLKEKIEKYKEQSLPAVILIPSLEGGAGYAAEYMSEAVKQAVGSDIGFGD